MEMGWSFPPNNFGKEDGLNDPGIETFLSKPLESLAREVIQNSRDATEDSSKPVIVQFSLFDVPRELFPNADEFKSVLSACGQYWNENLKAKKFFDHASSLLEQEDIRFLKISDFNTNGLSGAAEARGKDWHKLTKSVGASDKRGGKDGSFGIGKHAPFACSAFRSVFYGTKARDDKTTAFQGVAKLVTHLDENGNQTQGTGYFGDMHELKPIFDLDAVDKFFTRRRFGTDIFIPGFVFGDDWEERIVHSVLKNFFVSIQEGKLIVEVGDTRIDSTSLEDLMSALESKPDHTATIGFYKAIADQDSHVFSEDNFMEMGRIELHIAVDESLPKLVAMVRQSGMLVYVKNRFRTPLRFSAVFIARGEELNTFLTSLEPPAHDNWEPERHSEDVPFARQVLKSMHSWMVEKIKELTELPGSEDIDPEGIGQFLPDELDELEGKANDSGEEKSQPKPVEMQTRTVVPSTHQPGPSGAGEGEDDDAGDSGFVAEPSSDGGGGGVRTPPNGLDSVGDGGMGTAQERPGASPSTKLTKININRLRLFCSDFLSGEYILSFTPEMTGSGEIHLSIVGEVGNEPAPIESATDILSGGMPVVLRAGTIGPVVFNAGQRSELKVKLKEQIRCAMEVSAHAS
jgi:hypothetical protein